MKTTAGLWIDHRKAIVVTVTDKGEEMGLIISRVEKQPRRSGDSSEGISVWRLSHVFIAISSQTRQ